MSKYNSFDHFFNDKFNNLNKYLNIISNELEKKDSFLLKYFFLIDYWCTSIKQELKDNFHYELYDKESNLTFINIYNIARDIIKDINPKYLDEYDKVFDNGIIDFNYEKTNSSSSFTSSYGNELSININRSFTYRDIVTLIHEFFHYMNYDKNFSVNQNVLTEFISIYFETYAINYLRGIGISDEDINPYYRLNCVRENIDTFEIYSKIFTMFNYFGSIDNDSICKYQKRLGYINNYTITEQSLILLSLLQDIEQDYHELYEKDYSLEEIISELFKYDYKYILGTILAFYAIDNIDKESIILLNNNINSNEIGNMDILDLLNLIGINVNDNNFIDTVVKSIRKFVNCSEIKR